MSVVRINEVDIELDEDGFVVDPENWSRELAKYFATLEGIEVLSDEHWIVIDFIRQYYQEHQIAPMINKLCKGSGLSLRQLYDLFPTGPAKGACKLAGLPKPGGCV
ncbi:MAG: TusE/DsrC/DsvC family sulfur relay protein [Peptococcaceae bacterium]|nr:TusE/DsrC/DsvC family sulfur relay protein [Peptococcaceae bacterium]